jgi:hypothetical protein
MTPTSYEAAPRATATLTSFCCCCQGWTCLAVAQHLRVGAGELRHCRARPPSTQEGAKVQSPDATSQGSLCSFKHSGTEEMGCIRIQIHNTEPTYSIQEYLLWKLPRLDQSSSCEPPCSKVVQGASQAAQWVHPRNPAVTDSSDRCSRAQQEAVRRKKTTKASSYPTMGLPKVHPAVTDSSDRSARQEPQSGVCFGQKPHPAKLSGSVKHPSATQAQHQPSSLTQSL